jgi:[protein-PII] uridylyltransferase
MLNHLAFRRDNSDQAILLEVASEIGSPANLSMLFVLSCADLAAVGPGVMNQWKLEVLTDLYLRLMDTLSGGGDGSDPRMIPQREELKKAAMRWDDAQWFTRHIDVLPTAYVQGSETGLLLEDLSRLRELPDDKAVAWGRYVPNREVSEYSIGARENISDGIFYRLAGALASQGLEILSADIHSLADSFLLDKFFVQDPDYSGEPPESRFVEVSKHLVEALHAKVHQPPTFRRVWQSQRESGSTLTPLPTQIRVDNSTSERFTILDIFAHDRPGLLYAIAKTLHELGLSVQVAKIGTYIDQVVDVFYVTENSGKKILDESYLDEIRSRLYHAIESWDE